MGSVQYPRMHGEADMETQIHLLEQEANSSVLRAFKAQADEISWDKEGLMTALRKELRVSNEKHRELLVKANSDDVIRRIREWRQSGGLQHGIVNTSQAVHDQLPSPSVSATRKKQKNPAGPSQSFGGPSHSFLPQHIPQPASSSARRGPVPGLKGKNKKSQPPSGPTGRGPLGNRMTSGALVNESAETSFSPLIGKKVRTRWWPDDNNFYEAKITDFNPVEGRHALVYDIDTANETWEWVNLEEIAPEDIQWDGEDPGISHKGGYGGSRHGIGRPVGRDGGPAGARGRGVAKGLTRTDFPPSQNGIRKKGLDDIQLHQTESLIKEVERVFGSSHSDCLEIEKARKVLKEHEHALANAIARLADISDGESDEGVRFM